MHGQCFVENFKCNLVLAKQVQRMANLFHVFWVLWIQSDGFLQHPERLLDSTLLPQDNSMFKHRIVVESTTILTHDVLYQLQALLVVLRAGKPLKSSC